MNLHLGTYGRKRNGHPFGCGPINGLGLEEIIQPLDGNEKWHLRRAKTVKGWLHVMNEDLESEEGQARHVAADLLATAIEDLTWKIGKPPKSKYMERWHHVRMLWALDAFEWVFLGDSIRSLGTFAWCCEQLGDRPEFRAKVIFDLYKEDVQRVKASWEAHGRLSWRRVLKDPRGCKAL